MFDPKIKVHKPALSGHDISFSSTLTTNFGIAKPVFVARAFSGEKFKVNLSHLLKFQPMLAPAFQRYDLRFDSFIIPDDVHWKDCLKFQPQISRAFQRNKEAIPHCSINPVQLYLMVAIHSVYSKRIPDTVLNPFSGTLIDDFNFPTFDDLLDELRAIPDDNLADIIDSNFKVLPSQGQAGIFITSSMLDLTAEDLPDHDWNVVQIQCWKNTFRKLPFYCGDDKTLRNSFLRAAFLSLIFGEWLYNGSEIIQNHSLSDDASKCPLFYLSGKKDFDLLPFLAYQSLWREYYRNAWVDEDDSGDISGAYLPAEMDFEDIRPLINVDVNFENNQIRPGRANILDNITLTATLSNWSPYYGGFYHSELPWYYMWLCANGNPSVPDESFSACLRTIGNLVGTFDVNYVNDYFTSASISAQADVNVGLPIGGPFSVIADNPGTSWQYLTGEVGFGKEPKLRPTDVPSNLRTDPSSPDNSVNLGSIVDLRIANVMQVIQEKALLASSGRPYEFEKLFFGHIVSDARLHRPTFLNRVKKVVNISEVTQTGMSSEGQPLGDVAGKASSIGSDFMFDVVADEPSTLMIIMSIIPRPAYFQGVPVELCKTDPFDFMLPDMQHVGMRSIDTSELYIGVDTDGSTRKIDALDVPFGFTDIFNEYRCRNDEIHGEFRNSMAYWTSVRTLKDVPQLNKDFLRVRNSDEDLYKPFAITDGYTSHVIAQIFFSVKAARPIDIYPSYSL